MTAEDDQIQWYLARDGKQHGPLSDAEMKKLVELGHLRQTDLLWRFGFPDWRPAPAVFPPAAPRETPASRPDTPSSRAAPAPATKPNPAHANPATQPNAIPRSTRPAPAAVTQRPAQSSRPASAASDTRPYAAPSGAATNTPASDTSSSRPRWRRLAAVLIFLALGGGGIFAALKYKEPLVALIGSKLGGAGGTPDATQNARSEEPAQATSASAAAPAVEPAPQAPVPTAADLDAELQSRPLWNAVKQEFPEWYGVRLGEAVRLGAEGKTQADVTRHLVEALVALRRENAPQALAASTEKHKALANAFLANLKQLSEESGDGCYDFISKGETSPIILSRMNDPQKSAALEAQVLAVVDAISEGRRQPVVHTPPAKSDYDVLAAELGRLGWTQADMQLFADPKALARAPRDRVCNMLKDWFSAHLSIQDPAIQERLLFETLKPVISG